jgi:drug/metabolite transporter (DMT)-like permease
MPPPIHAADSSIAGHRSGSLRAALALLVNAFCWGLAWWPFRLLQEHGLHGLWATALVYLLVALAIVAWDRAAPATLLRTRSLWPLLLASGLTNACFNWAVTIGDVIRVVLLFYLMPAWAALFARQLLGEALQVRTVARIALAIAGAAVVLQPVDAPWPVPRDAADWLAITGGVGFALTNVMLRREAAQPESARALAMFIGGVVVAGGLAAVLTVVGTVPAPAAPTWAWLAGVLGLAVMFGLGNLCLQYGAARLAASVTAVVLLAEVPFAALSAIVLAGETLSGATLLGGAMILAAAALAIRDER